MGKKVVLEKIFAQLGRRHTAKKIFVWILHEIARTGAGVIRIDPKVLMKAKIYSSYSHDSLRQCQEVMKPFVKLIATADGDLFFSKVEPKDGGFVLTVNSVLDYIGAARGFGLFPASFLKLRTRLKLKDVSREFLFAAFLYAPQYIECLIENGCLKLSVRTIYTAMGRRFTKASRKTMRELVDRASKFAETEGMSLSIEEVGKTPQEYFDKTFVVIKFPSEFLAQYSAVFELDLVKKAEAVKAPSVVDTANSILLGDFLPLHVPEIDGYKEFSINGLFACLQYTCDHGEMTLDGILSVCCENRKALTVWVKRAAAYRKAVVTLLAELDRRDKTGQRLWERLLIDTKNRDLGGIHYGREQLEKHYAAHGRIVKDFVERLKTLNFLGELTKTTTLRLEGIKDFTVEELEEIVAGFKATTQQERKTVSC